MVQHKEDFTCFIIVSCLREGKVRNNICLDFGSIYDPFLLGYVSSWFKSEELKIAQELGKSSGAEE